MATFNPQAKQFTVQNLAVNAGTPRVSYRRRTEESKTTIHWGQRKLHLSEVEFFSLYWNPKLTPSPLCVYAGSAPGIHITLLSQMFPTFTFHLYDPADFQITETEKIKIFKGYFTDEIAQGYSGRRDVFFVSDIRTADYKSIQKASLTKRGINQFDAKGDPIGPPNLIDEAYKAAQVENEDQIWGDMNMQQRWVQLMNPEHALLKFRLPYALDGKDRTVEYLKGLVYWQIWPPQTSTETRLKPIRNQNGVYEIGDWSILEYEEWCFGHNADIREKDFYRNIFTDTNDPIDAPELLNDYDSMAEAMVLKLYLEKFGVRDPNTLYQRVIALSRLTTLAINRYATTGSGAKTLAQKRSSPVKSSSKAALDAFRNKRKGLPTGLAQHTAFAHTKIEMNRAWREPKPCDIVTFSVSGEGGLIHDTLIEILTGKGFQQVPIGSPSVNFAWGELDFTSGKGGRYRPEFKVQAAALKSLLGGDIASITDKTRLYDTVRTENQALLRYFPATNAIKDVFHVNPGKVLIGKPKGGFQQRGIEVITNDGQLENYRNRYPDSIVSDYVVNPMLINGYKFHVRVYYVVYVANGYGRGYFMGKEYFDIVTAEEPYVTGNWERKQIHVSSDHYTRVEYKWPDSLVGTVPNEVIDRAIFTLNDALTMLTPIIVNRAAPYPESDAAFEVLGVDVMFHEDGTAAILEVNTKVGFTPMHIRKLTFPTWSSGFMKWIADTIVLPHFGLAPFSDALWRGPSRNSGLLTPHASAIDHITLQPLETANDAQVRSLAEIGSDPAVYSNLGEGTPWDINYITEIRNSAINDSVNPCRQYYHWIIMHDKEVAGYISIRPSSHPKYSEQQLRTFVSPNFAGRGIGSAARVLVLSIIKGLAFPNTTRILSFISPTNIPSIRMATKTGFVKIDTVRIKNETLDVYAHELVGNPSIRQPATKRIQATAIQPIVATQVPVRPIQPIVVQTVAPKTPTQPIVVTPVKMPTQPIVVAGPKTPTQPIVVTPVKMPTQPIVVAGPKTPTQPIVVTPVKMPTQPIVVAGPKTPTQPIVVTPVKLPTQPIVVQPVIPQTVRTPIQPVIVPQIVKTLIQPIVVPKLPPKM
jgi:RimJ/RimL family protein N-acetyltransferase